MTPALLLLSAITWNFPGGSLGRVETLSPNHYRAHLAGDWRTPCSSLPNLLAGYALYDLAR